MRKCNAASTNSTSVSQSDQVLMNYFVPPIKLSTQILIDYITNPFLKQFQNDNEPMSFLQYMV